MATGTPDDTPETWKQSNRHTPPNGILFDEQTDFKATLALGGVGSSSVAVDPETNRLVLSFTRRDQEIHLTPRSGVWNWRAGTRLEVELTNVGSSPIQPAIYAESVEGPTPIIQNPQSLGPAESATLILPFASPKPWEASASETDPQVLPGTGSEFDSYRVERIVLLPGDTEGENRLQASRIQVTSPALSGPAGSGQRPPVDGDWTLTFEENFDGEEIDATKWNIYTENHWDDRSHSSKDNVILGDGLARLRFEKKSGRHNDAPDGALTDYQTGYLGTYDKFRQCYGYFEARLKLPTAPGLWPAFWAMPDRGAEDGPKWKRQQTSRGGMEFDIMEHLTRWGPHRYNIAFHWDGYGKGHKHVGTSGIYVNHDSEGFLTAGLLWLPGKAVYYCNGKEVARWESPRVSQAPSILMFTHVSGGWDNDALDPELLPDDLVIDYVRVWQRKDLMVPRSQP